MIVRNILPVKIMQDFFYSATRQNFLRRSRLQALRQAVELSNAGQHGSARPLFARAVDASPRLAALFMRELRKYSIPFFVSPFEADAQLGWLSRSGLVDAVLSEDSDCLPYRCHRVLFKLDKDGHAIEMTRPELFRYWGAGKLPLASPMQATSGAASGGHPAANATNQAGSGKGAAAASAGLHSIASVLPRMDRSSRLSKGRSSKPSMFQSSSSSSSSSRDGDKIDLSGFSDSMFLDMCVLCGCDYVDSPKGIGAAAACRWVKRFRGATQRMLSRMRFDGILPPAAPRSGTYEEQFRRARMTFLHQTVVDPRTGRQVRCQPLPQSAEDAAQAAIRKAVPEAGAGAGAGAGADTRGSAKKESSPPSSGSSSSSTSSSSSSWFPLGAWAGAAPTMEQRAAAEEAHRAWVRVRGADPLGFLGSPMPLALSRVVASGDFDPVAGEWLHSRHEAGAGAGAGQDPAMEALMQEIRAAREKAGVPLGASHGGASARGGQAGRSGPRGLLATFLSGAQRAVEKDRLQRGGASASAGGGHESVENGAGIGQNGGRTAAAATARASDRSSSSSNGASVSAAAAALAGSGVLQRLRGKMQSRVQRGFAGLDGMKIAPLGAFRAGMQTKAASGASAGPRSSTHGAHSSARAGTRPGRLSRGSSPSAVERTEHAGGLEWGGEGLASVADHAHGPHTGEDEEERRVAGTDTSTREAVAHVDRSRAGAHLSGGRAGSRSRASSLQPRAPAAGMAASL